MEDAKHNNEPEAIWDYIKYLRKQKGHNLTEFAEIIDCTAVHASRIEKPYHTSRCAASPRLLGRIAAACAEDEESREILKKKLMMKRARMLYSKEVVEDAFSDPASYPQLYSDSMPKEFIQRLQKDTEDIAEANVVAKLAMTREALSAVLAGRMLLSKHKVLDLAKKLSQSGEEYLLLAGYNTDGIRRLFLDKHFLELMKRAKKLSPEEIEQLGVALGSILSLIKKPSDKKKGGD